MALERGRRWSVGGDGAQRREEVVGWRRWHSWEGGGGCVAATVLEVVGLCEKAMRNDSPSQMTVTLDLPLSGQGIGAVYRRIHNCVCKMVSPKITPCKRPGN